MEINQHCVGFQWCSHHKRILCTLITHRLRGLKSCKTMIETIRQNPEEDITFFLNGECALTMVSSYRVYNLQTGVEMRFTDMTPYAIEPKVLSDGTMASMLGKASVLESSKYTCVEKFSRDFNAWVYGVGETRPPLVAFGSYLKSRSFLKLRKYHNHEIRVNRGEHDYDELLQAQGIA